MYGNSSDMEPDIDGRNAAGYFVEYDYESGGYKIAETGEAPREWSISEPHYLYQFESKESLMSSAVFQECLKQSLAFKDKVITDLQNELLNS